MGKPIYALDLSSAQPEMSVEKWREVKKAGIDAIWAKATEGNGNNDSHFLSHALNARQAGIYVGAYHYWHCRSGGPGAQDGNQQAWGFIQRYRQGKCELPPMVDVESAGQASFDPASAREGLTQFLRTTHLHIFTKTPLIYTDIGEWNQFGLNQFPEFAHYPLWLANVGGAASPNPPDPWLSHHKKPMLRQFSWKGSVIGIGVDVDVSAFYGSYSQLQAWAGHIPTVAKLLALGVGGVLYAWHKSR